MYLPSKLLYKRLLTKKVKLRIHSVEHAGGRFLAQSVPKNSLYAFWCFFCSLVWIILLTLQMLVGSRESSGALPKQARLSWW